MIYNNVIAREIADFLLEHKCVILQPDEPFTWASGLKSPIYCDNRKALSYVSFRKFIKEKFIQLITEKYKDAKTIAGVATAGIPWGTMIADELDKVFIYVRDKAKAHGLENAIEGVLEEGDTVVAVEDLISTGGSSLKVVTALREKKAKVLGMVAIFTYGFEKAGTAFAEAHCELFVLCDYPTLLEVALERKYISAEQKTSLDQWYVNPQAWSDKANAAANA